jgi:hypothetical protein
VVLVRISLEVVEFVRFLYVDILLYLERLELLFITSMSPDYS